MACVCVCARACMHTCMQLVVFVLAYGKTYTCDCGIWMFITCEKAYKNYHLNSAFFFWQCFKSQKQYMLKSYWSFIITSVLWLPVLLKRTKLPYDSQFIDMTGCSMPQITIRWTGLPTLSSCFIKQEVIVQNRDGSAHGGPRPVEIVSPPALESQSRSSCGPLLSILFLLSFGLTGPLTCIFP